MRVYFAQKFKDESTGRMDLRMLPSGSVYRATSKGWIRLNHPRNKHERKAMLKVA